ncbi:hypothetical protein TREMEDRAFT_66068 [Tremella mesenterica DSM 1558]|uniref:uncharacterized protein n=1 Tax=Tremella mesenterica (strain ATCC 24925 / CBS 8224 / DSM 1558 / NBRC 9311 / NRRL Y-6157 / RJB 2259-6 / UBC 559-6) TaxID=578456 RepID=UPI00032C5BE4|nr:uncharacterized protein TREMEDRAFT_66068 [Tremella mesenterica DSM 1558]EIW65979.1 hypothetical protein TREMEDRAFT_66068 [Tremella mesenterica DSM 1558]
MSSGGSHGLELGPPGLTSPPDHHQQNNTQTIRPPPSWSPFDFEKVANASKVPPLGHTVAPLFNDLDDRTSIIESFRTFIARLRICISNMRSVSKKDDAGTQTLSAENSGLNDMSNPGPFAQGRVPLLVAGDGRDSRIETLPAYDLRGREPYSLVPKFLSACNNTMDRVL